MKPTYTETKLITDYLAAVGARLSGPERDDTLAAIESHIHEAIAARDEEGPGVVEAVLAEMDCPDAYGILTDPPGNERLCKLALIGAPLLPWGLPVLWHAIRLTPAGDGMQPVQFYDSPLYHFFFLPLGLISMIVVSILGWQSAKRIVAAAGSLIGFPLAVLEASLYPLLLLNLFLFILVTNAMDVGEVQISVFLAFPVMALVLVGNILGYRLVSRSVREARPLRKLLIPAIVCLLPGVGLMGWANYEFSKKVEESMNDYDRHLQESIIADEEMNKQ